MQTIPRLFFDVATPVYSGSPVIGLKLLAISGKYFINNIEAGIRMNPTRAGSFNGAAGSRSTRTTSTITISPKDLTHRLSVTCGNSDQCALMPQ